jgi:hypothetical protein
MTSSAAATLPPPPPPPISSQQVPQQQLPAALSSQDASTSAPGPQPNDDAAAAAAADADTIVIQRTYEFAGKTHSETKRVARTSAEARLYLATHPGAAAAGTALAGDDAPPRPLAPDDQQQQQQPRERLPPRRAFRSIFEPAPSSALAPGSSAPPHARTDLDLSLRARLSGPSSSRAPQPATKLNTVQKSKLDWAGFVDKEGLREDLELAGKSKDAYVSRADFLARSDVRREDEARRARLAARA